MTEEQHDTAYYPSEGNGGVSFDPFEVYVAGLISDSIRGTQAIHTELRQHVKRVLWSHIGFLFLLIAVGLVGPISTIVSLRKIQQDVRLTAQEVEKTSQQAMEATRIFRMLHADDELASQRERVLLDRIRTMEGRLSLNRERVQGRSGKP